MCTDTLISAHTLCHGNVCGVVSCAGGGHKPIGVGQLAVHVEQLHLNENCMFGEEYKVCNAHYAFNEKIVTHSIPLHQSHGPDVHAGLARLWLCILTHSMRSFVTAGLARNESKAPSRSLHTLRQQAEEPICKHTML